MISFISCPHTQLQLLKTINLIMTKARLFLIFQLIHLSYPSDEKGRQLTVTDCLKVIETDAVSSFIQTEYLKEIANFRAKYIVNKFLMFNDKVDSTPNKSAEFYPYFKYRHSISNRVFSFAHNLGISIMIISTNCESVDIYRLKVLLQYYLVYCESLNANTFHPKKIFSSFRSLRVKMAILLLPRMLIQIYMEIAAAYHSEIFHYITVDYIPDAIRQVQLINPLLKISNLYLIDSISIFDYGLMNMMNLRECSISKEKTFDVVSCQYQSPKIIRIVTVFYRHLVFPVPNKFPTKNSCEIGLPCKTRLKEGRNKWLCCAGKYIDKLSAIMRNIKHPFIIYIVEDGRYGSLKNGSWNGLVDDLYQGKADIAIAEMTFTIDRYKVIDYIDELAEDVPMAFLRRRPKAELEILNFSFFPRSTRTLVCFLVLLHFAVFLIVYIFEYIAYQQNYGQKYSFKDSWSFVGAILFQRDLGGSATRSWPGRFLAIAYSFSMAVLLSTYTATLTAENVSYKDSPTFYGFRDKMFKDPMKRVGLLFGGIQERRVDKYNHTSKRIGVEDYGVAAKYLLEGKLDAVIGTYTALTRILMMNKRYCKELVLHIDEIEFDYVSWGCQKNSNICKLFSLNILKSLERNDFENIDKKWISVNSCTEKEAKKYPWQYACGLVICLSVATGMCAVILIIEKFLTFLRWKKRRRYDINIVD